MQQILLAEQVRLVEDEEHRLLVQPEVHQHLVDDEPLLLPERMAGVHDVEQQIGVTRLLERGAERGDQMVGKLADEPDRVGEQHARVLSQIHLARERVERREQAVLDVDVRAPRHAAQDGGLARVRVAHERRLVRPRARLALHRAVLLHVREPFLQQLDAVVDQPAVRLELRLARPAHADAAAELLEVRPHPRQPRQRVLQLGELDLHLGFARPRAGGEDVEDELRAIDHARAERLFDVVPLARRELVVEDDQRGVLLADHRLELLQLPLAQIRPGVRALELLRELPDDDGPRRIREALELAQMLVERLARAGPLDGRPHEERPLGRGRDGDQIACDVEPLTGVKCHRAR